MSGGEDDGTTATGTPTVFLSYARADQPFAQKLITALEGQGFRVWWDGLISGGHEFSEKIEQALSAADAVVVLWSEQSKKSQWVRDEAGYARDHHRLVPVSIDGAEAPLGFRQLNRINLKGWNGKPNTPQFDQLCQSIAAVSRSPSIERPAYRRGPAVSRRQAMAGGAALATAAAIGGFLWLRGSPAVATSIAVIPFRNLSGDPEQDYFSEGLAEELRSTLSQAEQLQVAAEASSDTFKDGKADAKAIAKALGVAFLVEGSVRRSPDTVRVATRIVDGKSGLDRWSQTFDRPTSDSLAVQSDIAAFVTDAVMADFDKATRPSERNGGTRKTEAFEAYLHGAALYREANGRDTDLEALGKFDDAVRIDPNYAVAHAARSRVLTALANTGTDVNQARRLYAKAIAAAREAIRLSPDLAEGHSALGFALLDGQLDVRAASVPYQRSFELGFGNADILSSFANFAARTGQFAAGREAIARAQRLDPLNPSMFRNAGLLELAARNYDAAQGQLRSALSMNPNAQAINFNLGVIAYLRGDYGAAETNFEAERDPITRLLGLAIIAPKTSHPDEAEKALAALTRAGGDSVYYERAQVLAQWGRNEEAIVQLQRALAKNDAGLVRLRNDPLLDPLRKDPRFTEIERRMGFI